MIRSLIAGAALVLSAGTTRYACSLAASQWRIRVTYPRRMRRLQDPA